MNKKVFSYFLIILISFMFISNVHAVSCANIDEKIDNYNSYTEQLESIDCNDTTIESNVSTCNDLNLKKNNIVTKLMKYQEEAELCSSNKDAADKIIEENSENCGKIFDDYFTDLVNNIMRLFYILGPVLLILLGTIDYTKATIESDDKALKKANQRFIRRTIATILLFLVPVITNIIISFGSSDYYLSGNSYSCDYKFSIYKDPAKMQFNKKVKQTKGAAGGGGGGSGSGAQVSGINFTTNYSNMIYKGGALPIPFPEDNFHTGSGFGPRTAPTAGASTYHKGVDLTATYNGSLDCPILAVADGTVNTVASGCSKRGDGCNGGAGNYVIISHNIDGNEFESVYMHMKTTPDVKSGQSVSAGTQVGIQGSTGTSTGEHLHFGIRVGGQYVDPYPYITGQASPKNN